MQTTNNEQFLKHKMKKYYLVLYIILKSVSCTRPRMVWLLFTVFKSEMPFTMI